eukprot:629120-Pyramimonas_sp.AAC.1
MGDQQWHETDGKGPVTEAPLAAPPPLTRIPHADTPQERTCPTPLAGHRPRIPPIDRARRHQREKQASATETRPHQGYGR